MIAALVTAVALSGTVAATRSSWSGDAIVTEADVRDAAGQVTTVVQLGGTVDGVGMTYTDLPAVLHAGDAVALELSGRAVVVVQPLRTLVAAGGTASYGVQRAERTNQVLWRPSSCIDVVLDTATISDDAARTLDTAFATWSTATAGCGGVSFATSRAAVPDAKDGTNTVHVRSDTWCATPELCYPREAAGVTRLVYIDNAEDGDNGKILEADMELNNVDFALVPGSHAAAMLDLQAVATHEAGHVLGLAHDCGTGAEAWPTDRAGVQVPACAGAAADVLAATMYYRIGPGDTGARSPEASDTDGACALLPGEGCQRYLDGGCAAGGGGNAALAFVICTLARACTSRVKTPKGRAKST